MYSYNYIILFLLVDIIINNRTTYSFVKQLLINPPSIQKRELWRRSPLVRTTYGNFTLTLTKSLEVPTPSYVQILQRGTLSITSFSLLRKGSIMEFDLNGLRSPHKVNGEYLWPNELSDYKDKYGYRILLVPDGFLMPGQNDGAIYVVRDPDNPNSIPIRITAQKRGWFYHRAMHIKLPGSEIEGILTARATKSITNNGYGELVWLTIPENYQMYNYPKKIVMESSPITQSSVNILYPDNSISGDISLDSLDISLEVYASPWKEVILAKGPDVMFELFDLDKRDDCIDIVAAHFFGRKLSIHSIRATNNPPYVEVARTSTISTKGRPYGLCLATLNNDGNIIETKLSPMSNNIIPSIESYDDYNNNYNNGNSDSFINYVEQRKYKSINKVNKYKYKQKQQVLMNKMKSKYKTTDCFVKYVIKNNEPTHILVTTHECNYDIPSAVNMAFSAIGGNYPIVNTKDNDCNNNIYNSNISRINNSLIEIDEIQKTIILDNDITDVSMDSDNIKGGSLYAYTIPSMSMTNTQSRVEDNKIASSKDLSIENRYNMSSWVSNIICTGFKVRGWGGIFSPGAPGFPYVFKMPNKPQSAPLILIAGDCTGSAYIFAPKNRMKNIKVSPMLDNNNNNNNRTIDYFEIDKSNDIVNNSINSKDLIDAIPSYELLFEIEVGATVGSAGLSPTYDGTGDVMLYIPAYELNKVHVFRLSENI